MTTTLDLPAILAAHERWLCGDDGGEPADLIHANLAGANLAGANLAGANLAGANLTRADLTRADLTGAYLIHADLIHADLTGATLTGANLAGANLTGAYLTGAYLTHANLAGANLARADLAGADLARANLAEHLIAQIGPIGSRGAYLVYCDGAVSTGCFRGTLAEFVIAVQATHGDNEHGQRYRAAIGLLALLDIAWQERQHATEVPHAGG